MAKENARRPDDEGGVQPQILTKPLPRILDEMDGNIRAAMEAARRAEEAARLAKSAAGFRHQSL